MSEPISLYPNLFKLENERDKDRAMFMLNKKNEIEKQLLHYQKLKTKWGRVDITIKIVGLSLALGTTVIGTFVGTSGLITPVIAAQIAGILSVVGGVKIFITETLSIGFTSKKKSYYRELTELLNTYISRFYLYFEKCREDGVISFEELENFNMLTKELEERMNGLKSSTNLKSTHVDKFETVGKYTSKNEMKQIKKDVVKTLKIEERKKIAEIIKQQLNQE